jgi:alpha-tubulin suppressor-like RCC1 family protein
VRFLLHPSALLSLLLVLAACDFGPIAGTSELTALVNTINALEEEDFTSESWGAISQALALPQRNAAEIATKLAALDEALSGLEFAGRAALDAAIAATDDLAEGDYTLESWENLEGALALPETSNAEVVAKTDAITDAIDGLVLAAQADLADAKNAANALVDTDYTPSSWGALQTALALPESDNADLVAKITAIADAIDALVFAGRAALDAALSAASALVESAYTAATWEALETALALPETSNAEVVAKTDAITLAINNLAFDVPPASYVGTGALHTCSLNAGQVYCWGFGLFGSLGNGATLTVSAATRVSDGAMGNFEVSSIAVGGSHTCALKAGEVYCWGSSNYGELGDGTEIQKNVPVKVVDKAGVFSNSSVTAIAAGGDHTCAIKAGEVYCWGDNFRGQLGDGTNTSSSKPVKVSDNGTDFSNSNVTAIAAGKEHTCAIKAESVYCWGHNGQGELNLSPATEFWTVPVAITLDSDPVSVTDIASHSTASETCALGNGSVYCWGRNANGEFGVKPPTKAPAGAIPSETDITAIAVGAFAVCALNAGSVYCWGVQAEVGDDAADLTAPVKVADGAMVNSGVTNIAAGLYIACAVKNSETYCWGSDALSNILGQLGSGDTSAKPTPNKVVFAQ